MIKEVLFFQGNLYFIEKGSFFEKQMTGDRSSMGVTGVTNTEGTCAILFHSEKGLIYSVLLPPARHDAGKLILVQTCKQILSGGEKGRPVQTHQRESEQ